MIVRRTILDLRRNKIVLIILADNRAPTVAVKFVVNTIIMLEIVGTTSSEIR